MGANEPAAAGHAGKPALRQLFAPGADAVLRLALWSLFILPVSAGVMLFALSQGNLAGNVGVAPEQPVPFSHKHHVAELGLDCRNCHAAVLAGATAGLPATHTCMTCHSQIWTGSSMLAPVRDSLAHDQPLVWARVNRLPDYVYFNHSIHVAKGVGCSSCHGAVDHMQLTARAQSFRMEFCIGCHRNPAAQLRPPAQIWNMEWSPPADQARLGAALVVANHVSGPQKMTDCSTCHR